MTELRSLRNNVLETHAVANRTIARVAEKHLLTPAQFHERSLIYRGSEPRPEVEAFRDLRTRLLSIADGKHFVTLVAPVSRGCGGSHVSRNLAAAFAFDAAKSALLIDCDVNHPSQHATMRINPVRGGLVDYLADDDMDLADVVYETGVQRLRMIPAGTQRDMGSEYFSSFRMRLLLDTLSDDFPERYLILDSPPVRGAPDARILSDFADVVVLVAGYGRDTPAEIAQAAANFDPNKFAGVVFNQGA